MCTTYFDGGVSTHQGFGGYVCLDKNGDLAFGQGGWLGEQCLTNNIAEMEALLMLMQSLVEHGVPGQVDTVLVIVDSQLIIDFANCVGPPSKARLFLGVQEICELEKHLSAQIMYQQVPREENNIVDWLCNVARQL